MRKMYYLREHLKIKDKIQEGKARLLIVKSTCDLQRHEEKSSILQVTQQQSELSERLPNNNPAIIYVYLLILRTGSFRRVSITR
jgi:hypothetical protein